MKAENWVKFANKLGYTYFTDNIYISGESWSLGGSWGNCWNDEMSYSSAEPQPEPEFFDDILGKLDIDMSYLKYKKLKNTCLTTKTHTSYGYYGGSETSCEYLLNVKELYSLLVEMEIINPLTFFND